jgi:hypothetical protein
VPEPAGHIPFDLYNNFIGAGWKLPTVREILFQERSVGSVRKAADSVPYESDLSPVICHRN